MVETIFASGPHLRDECVANGVAFWHKQHGGPTPKSGGRILDGLTWDEMPTHVRAALPENYVHRAEIPVSTKVQLPMLGVQ